MIPTIPWTVSAVTTGTTRPSIPRVVCCWRWCPASATPPIACELIQQVHDRTAGRSDLLITSDAHAPYATAIKAVYGVEQPQPRRPGPGRPPKPKRVLPPELCYATVCKKRKKGAWSR